MTHHFWLSSIGWVIIFKKEKFDLTEVLMTDDLQLEDDLEAEIENFLLENEDLIEDDEEVKLINRE